MNKSQKRIHAYIALSVSFFSCAIFIDYLSLLDLNGQYTPAHLALGLLLGWGCGDYLGRKINIVSEAVGLETIACIALYSAFSPLILRLAILSFGFSVFFGLLLLAIHGVTIGILMRTFAHALRTSDKALLLTATLLVDLCLNLWAAEIGYTKIGLALGMGVANASLAIAFYRRIHHHRWVQFTLLIGIILAYPIYRSSLYGYSKRNPASESLEFFNHHGSLVAIQSLHNDRTLTQHKISINGHTRLDSESEQSFQICLANIPAAAARHQGKTIENALVVGSQLGLTTRNLLSLSHIQGIEVLSTHPSTYELANSHPTIRLYNLDSLKNSKVTLLQDEPIEYLRSTQKTYDLIVVNIVPSLKDTRYHSVEFYRTLEKHLNPKGVLSVNAGPAFDIQTPGWLPGFTSGVWNSLSENKTLLVNRETNSAIMMVSKTKLERAEFANQIGLDKDVPLCELILNPRTMNVAAFRVLEPRRATQLYADWALRHHPPLFESQKRMVEALYK